MVTWSHVFALACTRRRCGALPGDCCGAGREFTAGESTWGAEAAEGLVWGTAASGGDTAGGEEKGRDWPASAGEAERAGEEASGDVHDSGAGGELDGKGRGAAFSSLGR